MTRHIFALSIMSLVVLATNSFAADAALWTDHQNAKTTMFRLLTKPYGPESKKAIAMVGIAETYLLADGIRPTNKDLISRHAMGLDLSTSNGRGAFIYRAFISEVSKASGFSPTIQGALKGAYRVEEVGHDGQ